MLLVSAALSCYFFMKVKARSPLVLLCGREQHGAGSSANPLASDLLGVHYKALEIGSLQFLSSFIIPRFQMI